MQDYVGKAKDDYVLHDRKCPQCGKLHTDITALKKHMNAWKGLDCVETRLRRENHLLSCTICEFKTLKSSKRRSNEALQLHNARFHREKKNYFVNLIGVALKPSRKTYLKTTSKK